MATVLVSIGSNINRHENIGSCLRALQAQFTEVQCSPVYESEAVGFDGSPFFNLVAQFDTEHSIAELSHRLKQIEDDHGRNRNGPKFSARTLDVDILIYDDVVGVIDGVELPRDEILKNAFVLLPLADLVPDKTHPVSQKSYLSHWQDYPQDSQKLWQIQLESPNS